MVFEYCADVGDGVDVQGWDGVDVQGGSVWVCRAWSVPGVTAGSCVALLCPSVTGLCKTRLSHKQDVLCAGQCGCPEAGPLWVSVDVLRQGLAD